MPIISFILKYCNSSQNEDIFYLSCNEHINIKQTKNEFLSLRERFW